MKKKTISNRIKRLARMLYLKLFRINDSPLKIALGFGLGVFVGVMPGIGPPVALLLAFPLRVNRAGALLGSILFNTWIGLLSLLMAVKLGSVMTGVSYDKVYDGWIMLIKNFSWKELFHTSVYETLIPIGIGYLIIALFFAVSMTAIVYFIALSMRRKKLSLHRR